MAIIKSINLIKKQANWDTLCVYYHLYTRCMCKIQIPNRLHSSPKPWSPCVWNFTSVKSKPEISKSFYFNYKQNAPTRKHRKITDQLETAVSLKLEFTKIETIFAVIQHINATIEECSCDSIHDPHFSCMWMDP